MRKGIDCTIVRDGNLATQILSKQSFDVVITEMLLDFKSGIEVVHFSKQLDKKPFCIIMTRLHATQMRRLAQEVGVDAYFTSPFDFNEIHDYIVGHVK